MAALSSHFILLYAIYQNILYIHQPANSTEAFVCLQELCVWSEMTPHLINNDNVPAFSRFIFSHTEKFKIKINFNDNVTKELDWIRLKKEKPPLKLEEFSAESSVIGLLCYLTLCSTILLLKCIVRILRKKKCLLMLE